MSKIVKGIVGAVEIGVGIATAHLWLIAMGVSTLLVTAASLITPGKHSGGLQTGIAYDPTFPRQIIVGKTITAGSLVAQFTHDYLPGGGGNDGQNRVLELVIALADHECDALEQIIVNGQVVNVGSYDATLGNPITTSLNPISGSISVNYTGKLWVMWHSGADGQTVDAHLQSVLGSAWPSTSVGTNVCYARVTCVYDQSVFSGIPQLQFVMRGAKLYDPRLDSSVGGSGSERFGTPSTYTWTDNLAVIAYNVCRGIYVGGNLFFGAGASAAEVPFAAALAAMNSCDETVSLKAGGTEKRYAGGGQTAVSSDAQSFLTKTAASMGGHIGTGGGSICILPGVAQTPAVSFTDDDIMAREPYDNAPKFGFGSLKNAVFATYINPLKNWTRNSLPKRTSSTDITTDGGLELGDTYSFDLVYSNTQAQRVMEIMRRRNRRQITQTVTLRPSAMVIERGDWVQWTSAQWSYSAKSFFAASVQLKPNLDIVLSLIEIDSTIFDWVPSTDELAPAGGLLPSADPPSTLNVAGFVATPLTELSNGSVLPRVQFTWTDPVNASVTGALIEYRLVGSTATAYISTADVGSQFAQLDAMLLPGANYEARMIFMALAGKAVQWTSWQSFIVPASMLLPAGVDPVSSVLQKALSPAASIRASVAQSVYFPWLDTMESAFAATAKVSSDLMGVHGVMRDAGIIRDPATGQVTISAVNAVSTDLQSYKTTVSATFNAVNASIALNVTTVQFNQGIAAVAAGFTPAYRYEFNSDANGWTANNATLSAAASILTYTGTGASPYLQSPTLALDAVSNPLVQIKLTRSAGSAWGMSVVWGSSYQYSQAVTVPTDPTVSNVVQADMTGNANWNGTVTGIRIALGDASSTFLIDYVAIGQSAVQALVVGNLTGQVQTLTSNVSLLSGQVSLAATSATVTALSGQLSTAQATINANTSAIALTATQANLNSTNATLSTVQSTLNAQSGQIQQVLAFASGQTAAGIAASPEQLGANISAALAGLIQNLADLHSKLEYARQGLYADVGTESGARVKAVLELQAVNQQTAASILSVQQVAADAVSAEASSRINGDAVITATIGTLPGGATTVAAAFSNESSARASADSANASNISTLTATIGTLPGGAATVGAAFSNEASVRASADSANASNTSTLTTTVNGHTTSISTITTSLNGVTAMWGVQINGNGAVTGLVRLDSGSTQSSFTVVANNFAYYDPTNGSTPLFTITSGIAYFSAPLVAGLINASTIIATNIITTGHIQAGAVTSFSQLSAPNPNTGTWVITGSLLNVFGTSQRVYVTYDSNGKVLINFSGSFTRTGGHSPTVTLNLYRYRGGGVADDLLAQSFSGGSGVTVNQPFSITYCDTAPVNVTGNASYYLTASSDDANVTVNNGVLWAMAGNR
jgi:hypothetical protein